LADRVRAGLLRLDMVDQVTSAGPQRDIAAAEPIPRMSPHRRICGPAPPREVLRQNEAMGVTVRVMPNHLDGFTRSAIRVSGEIAP
jgi:hypothetical protein